MFAVFLNELGLCRRRAIAFITNGLCTGPNLHSTYHTSYPYVHTNIRLSLSSGGAVVSSTSAPRCAFDDAW